jgi:hypothetical protein
VRDHHRHRRCQQVGAVVATDEIDFVDIEKFCEDPGHGGRVALIVVIDELDRSAQQPALGIGFLLPDFHRQQRRLAVGRETPGQPHAKADLDRFHRLRRDGEHSAEDEGEPCDKARQSGHRLAPSWHCFLLPAWNAHHNPR